MYGYDLNDPKHPGYVERLLDLADDRRASVRVEPPALATTGG